MYYNRHHAVIRSTHAGFVMTRMRTTLWTAKMWPKLCALPAEQSNQCSNTAQIVEFSLDRYVLRLLVCCGLNAKLTLNCSFSISVASVSWLTMKTRSSTTVTGVESAGLEDRKISSIVRNVTCACQKNWKTNIRYTSHLFSGVIGKRTQNLRKIRAEREEISFFK